MIQGPLVTAFTIGVIGAAESGGGDDSTVAPEQGAAIDAGAEAGAEAGVARATVNGVPQPAAEGEIVVGPTERQSRFQPDGSLCPPGETA